MVFIKGFCDIPLLVQNELDPHLAPGASSNDFPRFETDYQPARIDLSKAKIKSPFQTYFVKVTENAMAASGIAIGDVLVVDRILQPYSGALILAYFEGEYILRRIEIQNVYPQLYADAPDIPRVEIEPDMEFSLWGVVRDVLKADRVRV